MAIIGNKFTLIDAAKRVDPDGTYAKIAEVLQQSNPILDDMPFFPSNAPRGNRVTFRTGLPTVQWSALNKGIQPSKSQVSSHEDTIGTLEGRSEVDRRHKGLSMSPANYAAFRYDEDQTFLESMSQEMAKILIAGDETTQPAAFTGFLPRLSNSADALYGKSVTKALSSTHAVDTASQPVYYESILIVDWGERYCHGIYPYNTPAGLSKEDHPNEKVVDSAGGVYYADVSTFNWSMGLTIKNPKHIHAIRNIVRKTHTYGSPADTYNGLDSLESDQARPLDGTNIKAFPDVIGLMIKAMNNMDPCTNGQRVIYCSKSMLTALEFLARNTHNMMLQFSEWDGKPVTTFRGYPIKGVDYLDVLQDSVGAA